MLYDILNYMDSAINDKILVNIKCPACGNIKYCYVDKLQDVTRMSCDCEKSNEQKSIKEVTNRKYNTSKRIAKTYERLVKTYGTENVAWKKASEFIEWSLRNGYKDWKKIDVRTYESGIVNENNCCWVASSYGVKNGKPKSRLQTYRAVGGSIEETISKINSVINSCKDNKDNNDIICILSDLRESCDSALERLDKLG